MLSSLPCFYAFADLLSLHLVSLSMLFILVHVTFFSSRCMLELKFAIYYRAASLPSQAVFLRSTGRRITDQDWAFLEQFLHTNSISNSAILHNNHISLLSDLCAAYMWRKKWCHKGSHSSSVSGPNCLVWLQ